ncbi:hypothetical protein [Desulfosporosinus sp. BICA1-9]|uniref:hypothetical protein n=1 Tax=Desulfosporosinus sp. BICA1-9 TaxID=1531958 RepID=UPI00054BA5AE|nr:hypothetical protein [Desulfosporosinus sp. BICA1-9]KJS50784.1 MAG: hypothetical protein VR66_00770 [Peptococcaceae bacterium BRH_c23]KJS89535.1 MAG: hypothetical protein JL57_06700 [Desulfosporosinus sp. BICA1-9]HBW37786.1 hypothetical protein [Desulfosporosinus sp.]
MFMGLTLPQFHLARKGVLLIVIGCLMLIGFKSWVIEGVLQSNQPVHSSTTAAPLLLNNGMVQAQEAEVSIILWSEDGTIPIELWTQRPMPDWKWSHEEQLTKRGNSAATLTGHRVIDKTEERMLYTWYTTISPILAKEGVKIYLDERIPEAIDISGYLCQSNTLPSQWFLLDNMVSIAGYQSNIGTSVMAGQDKINIQLLSRGQNTDGQTVLAIPALLKEF